MNELSENRKCDIFLRTLHSDLVKPVYYYYKDKIKMKNSAKIELKVKIIHTFSRSIYLVYDMGHAREISLICQKSNFFKVHDRFSHNKLIRTTIIRFIKISNYYCIVDLNQQRGGLKIYIY